MSGTPGLQEDQIKKAVAALLKHVERQQAKANELLEEDELLYLVRSSSKSHPSELLWPSGLSRIVKAVIALDVDQLPLLQIIALKKTPQDRRKDKPRRMYAKLLHALKLAS